MEVHLAAGRHRYRVHQQKPDAQYFNSKETFKTGLKLIINSF